MAPHASCSQPLFNVHHRNGPMKTALSLFLTFLLGACAMFATPGRSYQDQSEIRAARGRLNHALSEHNIVAMHGDLADSVSLTGPVWRTAGRDQLVEGYADLI